MTDHLGCGERSESPALFQRTALRQSVENSSGILIACPGSVDDLADLVGGNLDLTTIVDEHRAECAHGDAGQRNLIADLFKGRLDAVGFVQAQEFVAVGEQRIHWPGHKIAELGVVAIDAKRVRQRQRNTISRLQRGLHCVSNRLLGRFDVPQIPLAEEQCGSAHKFGVDVGRF